MKVLINFLLIFSLSITTLSAQSINNYRWQNRVLILFTPEPQNELFELQYRLLDAVEDELVDRSLVVMLVEPSGDHENLGIFLDEAQSAYLYRQFGAQPYQFEMVLLGLDGNKKLHARNVVTPTKDIFDLIDQMPIRQNELRNRTGKTGSSNTKIGKNKVRY
jgi:hypothetical protein